MAGVPCIRGMRIPVATVVGMVADGMNTPSILGSFPDLEPDDVTQALHRAAEAVQERACSGQRSMRSLVEQCLSTDSASALTEAGHDVAHQRDVGIQRAKDLEVLDRARAEQRILVSADTDLGTLLARAAASPR